MSEHVFSLAQVVWAIILSASIPSATFAYILRRFEKRMNVRDDKIVEKEKARLKHETLMITLSFASLTLAEATAEAVQRIPDAHCNGDMHTALEKAKSAKEEYRKFETEQAVRHLH